MEKNENGFSEYFMPGRTVRIPEERGNSVERNPVQNGNQAAPRQNDGYSQRAPWQNDGCSQRNPMQNGGCGCRNIESEERVEEGDSCRLRGSLAMVYSPYQNWRMTYSQENALKHGTLFEELYMPLEDCYGK